MVPSHIRTESDVTAFWKTATGELGFDGTRLYFALIDEHGYVVPCLNVLDDNPESPSPQLIDSVCDTLRELLAAMAPRGTVALLWARPGRGPLRSTDRLWARELTDGLRLRRIGAWPMHFANDSYLRVLAADDLAA